MFDLESFEGVDRFSVCDFWKVGKTDGGYFSLICAALHFRHTLSRSAEREELVDFLFKTPKDFPRHDYYLPGVSTLSEMYNRKLLFAVGAIWEFCDYLKIPYPRQLVEDRKAEILKEAEEFGKTLQAEDIPKIKKGQEKLNKLVDGLTNYAMGVPVNEELRALKPVLKAFWAFLQFDQLYWETVLRAAEMLLAWPS